MAWRSCCLWFQCNGLWRFCRDGLRSKGCTEEQATQGLTEWGVTERRQQSLDASRVDRIGRRFGIHPSRTGRHSLRKSRNFTYPQNHLPHHRSLKLLIEGRDQPVSHHAELMQPHRVRHVDDQSPPPDGTRLGVLGDLRPDDGRPDPPDLMLTDTLLQTETLEGGRERLGNPDGSAPR